jgi:hypothetical protein
MADVGKYLEGYGKQLPPRLAAEQRNILAALSSP